MEQTQVSAGCESGTEGSCCVSCAPAPAEAKTPAPLSTTRQAAAGSLPVLRRSEALPDDAKADVLARVRRFCSGDAQAGELLEKLDASMVPAALYPYRSPDAIRSDFPVLLSGTDTGELTCTPIADALVALATALAPEPDQARVLKDNLTRLEIEIRSGMTPGATAPAGEVIETAGRSLEAKLALKGESGKQLHEQLGSLVKAVTPGSVLLPMSDKVAVEMFLFVARSATAARAEGIKATIKGLRGRLRDLLTLERGKGQGGGQEKLSRSMGSSGVDAGALAKLLDRSRPKVSADTSRCDRIERTIAVFDAFLNEPTTTEPHVVAGDGLAPAGVAGVRVVAGGVDPCAAACAVFDELARQYTALFVAMRTARLELDGAYDPRRHDALATTFDWRSFSREELRQLPPVLAIEDEVALANRNMRSLSRVLLSGRPIDVLVQVTAATDPGASDSEALARYRMELGYVGVGHREALVNQSTASRPDHLMDGFVRGLSHTSAALHVVMSATTSQDGEPPVGSWLFGGAALEARAHPIFHYDPQAGRSWARRLDFSQNPSPDDDWPECAIAYTEGGQTGSLASHFTFADFALLDGGCRGEFRVLPDGLESPVLFEASAYFAMDVQKAREAVPFVWAAGDDGVLRRVTFTHRLGFACRDRLDFWQTLQELAGVRNEYVRDAVERERERLETAFAAERSEIETKHAAELETVREQAGGEALSRLAAALTNADIGAFAASATSPAAAPKAAPASVGAPSPSAEPAASEPAPAAVVEEEETEPAEPWVDTVLCTSCNDCVNLNAQVFKYNANKQVVIADPKAGTFLQLVQAAEKCPARCIHPGKPLNASEPGLAELIERAKPFN